MSKNFLEGWRRKFSAGVSRLVKKPSTVLLYRRIVFQPEEEIRCVFDDN